MKAQTRSRCLLFAAFVMLLPFDAHAQLLKGFGVKLGANSANVKLAINPEPSDLPSVDIETKRKIGPNAAFFAEWFSGKPLSMVAQVEYARRGFVEEQIITGENDPTPLGVLQIKTHLDYLSLPILLKLQRLSRSLSPYLILGPRFDFLLHHEVLVDGTSLKNLAGFADYYDKRALGGTVGFGLASGRLFASSFFVETRYNFDFADNIDLEALEAKNNAVDLWMGVRF